MGRFVFALAIVSVLELAATSTAGAQIKIGARVLTGWRLHDNQHHRYTFGTFTLCGGCHVNIRTGHGTDTAKNHFWGMSNYVWNNTGDKATLVRVVDVCKWGASGPGFKKC
jgi:hypothetical protein